MVQCSSPCIFSRAQLCFGPELIHPFASSVDSPELEVPKKMVWLATLISSYLNGSHADVSKIQVCIKLNSKPGYVCLPEGDKQVYQDYGPNSLEDWHKKNGLYEE
jgi:hypothetical protein